MIYVWDNGQDYADHRVSFIECAAELWPDVRKLLGAYRWERDGYLVAYIERMTWVSGRAMHFGALLSTEWVNDFGDEETQARFSAALTPATAAELLRHWEELEARSTPTAIGADPKVIDWLVAECHKKGWTTITRSKRNG